MAEALDSVSVACRQRAVTGIQFYEYKKRFQEQRIEGVKVLPPIHNCHLFITLPEVQEQAIAATAPWLPQHGLPYD